MVTMLQQSMIVGHKALRSSAKSCSWSGSSGSTVALTDVNTSLDLYEQAFAAIIVKIMAMPVFGCANS